MPIVLEPRLITKMRRLIAFKSPDGQSFMANVDYFTLDTLNHHFRTVTDHKQLFSTNDPPHTFFYGSQQTIVSRLFDALMTTDPSFIEQLGHECIHATWMTQQPVGVLHKQGNSHHTSAFDVVFQPNKYTIWEVKLALPSEKH
jgi:hypothetical protein